MASSRVGLRIRTFIVLVRGTATRASITGIENARVLPVPVCAVATTSRPSMSGGMASAWTGVGVTNSFLSRFFRNAEQRLNSEKCFINCVRFFLRRIGLPAIRPDYRDVLPALSLGKLKRIDLLMDLLSRVQVSQSTRWSITSSQRRSL